MMRKWLSLCLLCLRHTQYITKVMSMSHQKVVWCYSLVTETKKIKKFAVCFLKNFCKFSSSQVTGNSEPKLPHRFLLIMALYKLVQGTVDHITFSQSQTANQVKEYTFCSSVFLTSFFTFKLDISWEKTDILTRFIKEVTHFCVNLGSQASRIIKKVFKTETLHFTKYKLWSKHTFIKSLFFIRLGLFISCKSFQN